MVHHIRCRPSHLHRRLPSNTAANLPHPVGTQPNPSTAINQAGPICFRCSKAGHLGRDCKQGKLHAAAACLAKDKEGIPEGDHLKEEDQEETTLVIGVEQDDAQLNGDQYLNTLVEDEGTQGRPYQWDNELAELAQPEAPSVKMGAICISKWKCGGGEGDNTKISTPLTVQATVTLPLVMQSMPAPLDMQHMLVHVSLAIWQVPSQVVIHRYTITMCTNTWAHDLQGLIPTAKPCQASGTSMVSKCTVY